MINQVHSEIKLLLDFVISYRLRKKFNIKTFLKSLSGKMIC